MSNSVDVAVDSERTRSSRTDFTLTAMIPCFNEEACIERAYLEIRREMQAFPDHEILFVDDGSTDNTLAAVKSFAATDPRVKYVSFTRNFGLEAAFAAGFKYAGKTWTVQMDADLQSPPEEIVKLADKAMEGYDVVYAIRQDRRDPWVRRMGSLGQQAVAMKLLGIDLQRGASAFRMVRTSVARRIVSADVRTPYFIATAPLLGTRFAAVQTAHRARVAGRAKWNMRRLVGHTMDLWIGFSVRPLVFLAGTAAALVALASLLLVLLAVGTVGPTGIAVMTVILCATTLLAVALLLAYLVPVLTVKRGLPRYLIRESNIAIDPADDLYQGEHQREHQPEHQGEAR